MAANIRPVFPKIIDVINCMAKAGDIDTLKWYMKLLKFRKIGYSLNNTDCDKMQPCDWAAMHGQMDMVKWIITQGGNYTCTTTYYVAKSDIRLYRELSLLDDRCLKKEGCRCNYYALQLAMEKKDAALVRWLKMNVQYYPTYEDWNLLVWNPNTGKDFEKIILSYSASAYARHAAEIGDVYDLKMCVKHGAPLNGSLFAKAAKGGQLSILKYLLKQKCKHDFRTFLEAAKSGNIVIMEWLKENNFEWDFETIEAADKAGQSGAVKWLKENGCPH